jgi:hypothetical protein
MAADDLSPVTLPPLAWTSNTNSRDAQQDSSKKPQQKASSAMERKSDLPAPPDIEFERTEHELDSIA